MKDCEKRALVIGASEEAEFAIKTAQQRGYFVAAVDGDPKAKGLGFADRAIVADIRSRDELLSCLDGFEPQLVLPVPIGRYLTATGVVNDYFGLKGVSLKSAELCTDKYAFHQVLHRAGLREGECLLLDSGLSRQDALEKCDGYLSRAVFADAILKPRFGSGSRGVSMVSSAQDISDYFEDVTVLDEDLVLEPAYPGCEYGADGIVRDGVLEIVLLREKIISDPPYRQAVAYIANHVCAEQREKACGYLRAIAEVLEFRDCVIHCDLMWDGNSFKVIEISARPSGHNLHNLFVPIVTGVNMIDSFIDVCEGRNAKPVDTSRDDRVYLIGYFDRGEGKLHSVPTSEAIVERFADTMIDCKFALSPGLVESAREGHGLMSRGYFVVSGTSREDVLDTRGQVLDFVFSDFTRVEDGE